MSCSMNAHVASSDQCGGEGSGCHAKCQHSLHHCEHKRFHICFFKACMKLLFLLKVQTNELATIRAQQVFQAKRTYINNYQYPFLTNITISLTCGI